MCVPKYQIRVLFLLQIMWFKSDIWRQLHRKQVVNTVNKNFLLSTKPALKKKFYAQLQSKKSLKANYGH